MLRFARCSVFGLFCLSGLLVSSCAKTEEWEGSDSGADGGIDGSTADGSAESDASEEAGRDASEEAGRDASEGINDAGDDKDAETDKDKKGGCGDGKIQPGEKCDDGNNEPADGCSAECDAIDALFVCPTPGEPCVSTVRCGDGVVVGNEECDDANTDDGDGCSGKCELQAGWLCPEPGSRCEAAECGDGIIAGQEECDDANAYSSDGCTGRCRLENGWVCDEPGKPCRRTVCNDGVKEGSEPCDDGNNVIGDGCNPFCEVEPDCSGGACQSACGDGLILTTDNEACDDANTRNGDGCSSDCSIENGWVCELTESQLPDVLQAPITYRDFIALPPGNVLRHPDFEAYSGEYPTPGLVEDNLGTNGKPVYTGICETGNMTGPCPYDEQTTSQVYYDQWYSDVSGVNITIVERLPLGRRPDGNYFYPNLRFFPFDGKGWVLTGDEEVGRGEDGLNHNFGFTSEIRYWFEFSGGEFLAFSGDDDVWVFINSRLALDLGGMHPRCEGTVTLRTDGTADWVRVVHDPSGTPTPETGRIDLGLEQDKIYEIVLFHAERHTEASNFNLTLGGFVSAKSECTTECGDGIVVGDEECDDGVNDGSYGGCTPDCRRGPFCGDGIRQRKHEECDDGVNLTTYSTTGEPACAPGCRNSGYCGDGEVDALFGEQCDEGKNAGGYSGCGSDCKLGPRCGDGKRQKKFGEQCDDGNLVNGDGCDEKCQIEPVG